VTDDSLKSPFSSTLGATLDDADGFLSLGGDQGDGTEGETPSDSDGAEGTRGISREDSKEKGGSSLTEPEEAERGRGGKEKTGTWRGLKGDRQFRHFGSSMLPLRTLCSPTLKAVRDRRAKMKGSRGDIGEEGEDWQGEVLEGISGRRGIHPVGSRTLVLAAPPAMASGVRAVAEAFGLYVALLVDDLEVAVEPQGALPGFRGSPDGTLGASPAMDMDTGDEEGGSDLTGGGGLSLEDRALEKAVACVQATGVASIAESSGFEVEPAGGVGRGAHFAFDSVGLHVQKLLELLGTRGSSSGEGGLAEEGPKRTRRRGVFRCVLCFLESESAEPVFESGECACTLDLLDMRKLLVAWSSASTHLFARLQNDGVIQIVQQAEEERNETLHERHRTEGVDFQSVR